MYTRFFGLNEKPFSITPDPRYLFMSERHTEALAHLLYGVKESGGFIQLTGEVGTGKTTLVRSLLQQLPENTDVALILNPQISRAEFLSAICDELGAALPAERDSMKSLTDVLNSFLLRNHSRDRKTILIVDEAQNLRVEVLEQVRLLTNLETTKQKLLQIILIGQPELRAILDRQDMRQLAQRITGRYHLEPLSREETIAYIDHRMKVAGGTGPVFTVGAKREIYRLSSGVPRMINVIADRALLGAFTTDSHQVSPALVRRAAAEVYDRRTVALGPWYRWARAGMLVLVTVVMALSLAWTGRWVMDDGRSPASIVQKPAELAATPAPQADAAVTLPDEPAEDPPAKLASLESLLKIHDAGTGTDDAFATLFKLWGATYHPGPKPACKQAEQYNLHCMFQRGSLSQVRSLDRPAILTLRDATGEQHQVVIAGLEDGAAGIAINGSTYRIATDELARFWFGEYLLLWRPQIGQVKSFFPGMRDQDVKWLRKSLAEIQGTPVVPMSSDLYDDKLEARVRDYQRNHRLTVDGLAGQQTQIAINSDLHLRDTPHLISLN